MQLIGSLNQLDDKDMLQGAVNIREIEWYDGCIGDRVGSLRKKGVDIDYQN